MEIITKSNEICHIHTWCCGHATGTDREMVEACLKEGAQTVTFTDHAPFPGDPFGNRMSYSALAEYIETLSSLKVEYSGRVDIHLGLETEYFPQYEDYYKELNSIEELDAGLLLGQHMYYEGGSYSFSFPKDHLTENEYLGLGRAIVDGIESGFFRRIAHPDRIYRKKNNWDDSCRRMAEEIVKAAIEHKVPMELNASSERDGLTRREFWDIAFQAEGVRLFTGLDAHSPEDVKILNSINIEQKYSIAPILHKSTL